jgi:hypothetical protein
MRTGVLLAMLLLTACSRSNNLLLGRVQAEAGSHTVVVTDCYRTSVPPPQRLRDAAGRAVYRFMPCRDADVLIRGDELLVNGQSYGRLNPADAVLVDHGVVSIERRPR